MPQKHGNDNERKLTTPQSVNAAIKAICDIMRRSNCAGALQYVPELTWILFLRILDEHEARGAEEAEAVGAEFAPSLMAPYRWQDWAAPDGTRRLELQMGTLGGFFDFVNGGTRPDGTRYGLLPYLKALKEQPNATPRQRIISEIMSGVERVRIDTERNLLDVLDKVHEMSTERVDPTHVFTLSQVYEGLLLKMGEKNNDGGQFFTPREIIRVMIQVIDPQVGKKTPLTLDCFDEFFRLLPTRADSTRSWTVSRTDIAAQGYDLKAMNPHAKRNEDSRTPEALLDLSDRTERSRSGRSVGVPAGYRARCVAVSRQRSAFSKESAALADTAQA